MSKVYVCWKSKITGKVGRGKNPISQEDAAEWIKLQKEDGSNMEYWTERVPSDGGETDPEK
jgi:hypothetical protein